MAETLEQHRFSNITGNTAAGMVGGMPGTLPV